MLLELDRVSASYGRRAVITDLSLQVEAGGFLTMLGPNGAGKTTIARVIAGLLPVRSGSVRFGGRDVTSMPPERRVRIGIGLVPQGRELFPAMSVLENLQMGAFSCWGGDREERLNAVFAVFPRLRERRMQLAGTLSGGEQQMLAIGRALMSRPQLLVLDEPSLGLAPRLVAEILKTIRVINERGTAVLLIEQNARLALQVSREGVVLESGVIRLSGPAHRLAEDPEVAGAYLGIRRAEGP